MIIKIIKKLVQMSLCVGLVFVLSAATAYGFTIWKMSGVKGFCEQLSPDVTPEIIMKRATEAGYFPYDARQSRNIIHVVNQLSPYWRFACEVEFDGDKYVKKAVVSAD